MAATVHYSDAGIQALMAEAPRIIRSPLRAAAYQTLIGLLAATGGSGRRFAWNAARSTGPKAC